MVRSATPVHGTGQAVYEQPALLDQYLLLHFGGEADRVPVGISAPVPFPVRCVELLRGGSGRALDLGCAVGGASFQLARDHEAVLAVDLSAQFIAAARALQDHGRLDYLRHDEGERTTRCEARIDAAIDRSRISFVVADACALAPELGPFDTVLAGNLLCRVRQPRALLSRLAGWVRPGGRLLLTTPLTWLPEFTPREEWLGGRAGEADGETTLAQLLAPAFELVAREDLPVVLREHARKYQLIMTLATLWRRRSAK
jgi:putative 4-mercaptohistidine N1-methyltranferase